MAAGGRLNDARREAREALRQALDAQRLALAQFEDQRRAAQQVVRQIDDRLDEIEELFTRLPSDLDEETAGEMSSLLKATRREGAGLWLAFEEHRFSDVIEERSRVLALLEANRGTLRDVVGSGAGGL
jgi:septal ring factor EnvC (AmiA/AmiB activator)